MPEWGYSVILAFVFYFAVTGAVLWAAWGRGYWFLRTAAAGTPLIVLAGMGLHGPLLFFALMAGGVFFWLWLWTYGWKQEAQKNNPTAQAAPRLRLRFTLKDMLLLTVVAAVTLAVVVRIPRATWEGMIDYYPSAISLSLLTSLGVAHIAMRIGRPVGGILPTNLARTGTVAKAFHTLWLLFVVCVLLVGVAHVGIYRWKPRVAPAPVAKPSPPPPPPTPPPAPRALPNPNGYDDLVKAVQMLAGVELPKGLATVDERKRFLARQAAVLETARLGLNRPCCVPLRYDQSDHRRNFGQFHPLEEVFQLEGETAREEGRISDAVQSYLDLYRLGQAISRGGLRVDHLQAASCEVSAALWLGRLQDRLSEDDCHTVLAAIERIEATWESLDDQVATEILWRRWSRYLDGFPWAPVEIPSVESYWQRTFMKSDDNHRRAFLQLLVTTMVLRRYSLDHGEFPPSLVDLVPDYLPAVPEDPHSGRPLCYRRQTDGYRLYSVGRNGRDDGGELDIKGGKDDWHL